MEVWPFPVVQNATGWEDGRVQTQKSIARSLLRLRPKRFLRSRRSKSKVSLLISMPHAHQPAAPSRGGIDGLCVS